MLYGRLVFRAINFPVCLRHDLLAQFLGVCEVVSYGTKSWRGLGRWIRQIRHPCNGSAFLRGRIHSFLLHVTTFTVVGGHLRIWHVSSLSRLTCTDLLLCFVAGKFLVGTLTWLAESSLRDRLLMWLERSDKGKNITGKTWFGRITQSKTGTRIFHDRLHNAVVWLVAAPIVGYGCVLAALHMSGLNHSQFQSTLPPFFDSDSYETLVIQLARYHVLLSWVYVATGVLVEVAVALLRDMHDTAYSERYVVGRILENLREEKEDAGASAATGEAATD